jgi:hypothetical protein
MTLPTTHKFFPGTCDGRALAEPLIVSIDLSEIVFASVDPEPGAGMANL